MWGNGEIGGCRLDWLLGGGGWNGGKEAALNSKKKK